MHKLLPALAAAACALISASPALAADRTVTLDATAKKATWDGKAGPGTMELQDCSSPLSTCESTLIKVDDPGTLIVSISADPTLNDANLALYASDAAGKQGDALGTATGLTSSEKLGRPVEPGYYLAVTTNEQGYGSVHGTAELLGDADEWSVAAPDKRKALDAAAPQYTWTGLAGSGAVFDCGEVAPAIQPCDDVLIHLTEPGDLSASMANASPTSGLDYISIYASNQAGEKIDPNASLAQGIDATTPNQSAVAGGLDPGYYLIEVGWLASVNGSYDGTATFTPAPPDDPGTAG